MLDMFHNQFVPEAVIFVAPNLVPLAMWIAVTR